MLGGIDMIIEFLRRLFGCTCIEKDVEIDSLKSKVDDLLKHDDAAEFMSFQNETNINYDEVPKELEIKDGINRLKQLALKVSAYMHVKHHDPVPWMFQNDDIKTEKGPTFHLRQ